MKATPKFDRSSLASRKRATIEGLSPSYLMRTGCPRTHPIRHPNNLFRLFAHYPLLQLHKHLNETYRINLCQWKVTFSCSQIPLP
jgi:hypothetical protein